MPGGDDLRDSAAGRVPDHVAALDVMRVEQRERVTCQRLDAGAGAEVAGERRKARRKSIELPAPEHRLSGKAGNKKDIWGGHQ